MASAVPRYQSSPGGPHLRGNGNDEVIAQQAGRLPALAQVLQQRLALELDQHVDGIDAGVDQVTQDKVDDPVAASEGNGGFGALLGERIEPSSFAPCQNKRKNAQLHCASLRQHSI